jgi:hypothetical protein
VVEVKVKGYVKLERCKKKLMRNFEFPLGIEGHTVAQFVEALGYKPEGRGFDSQWCHWNFLLI